MLSPSKNERVAFRRAIISAYGAVLERQGPPLRSTAELPFPKAIIRAALEDELKRGDPANERFHQAITNGLMGLDDFVDPESSAAALKGARVVNRAFSLSREPTTPEDRRRDIIMELFTRPEVRAYFDAIRTLPLSLPPQLSPPQRKSPWKWGFPTNIVGVAIGAGILAGLLGLTIDDIAQGRLSRFPGWGPTVMVATILLLIATLTIMAAATAVRQIRDTARLSRILRQRGERVPFWRLLLQRAFEDPALELSYWLWWGQRRAPQGAHR